jgi:hypothetical protein
MALSGNTPALNSTAGASGAMPNVSAPRIWKDGALRPLVQKCKAGVSPIREIGKPRAAENYMFLPPISETKRYIRIYLSRPSSLTK